MSGDESENLQADESGTLRGRSRVACQPCHQRKVRCDVARKGIPCSNCTHDEASCVIRPRKKHRPHKPRNKGLNYTPRPREETGLPSSQEGGLSSLSLGIQHENSPSIDNVGNTRNSTRSTTSHSTPLARGQLFGPLQRPVDAINYQSSPGEILPDDSAFSFIGDKRGPRSSVYDLCQPAPVQDAISYLPSTEAARTWRNSEIDYLRDIGVFETFTKDVSDKMIQCYFHQVHFFLPIVDIASFLNEYNANGFQNINLLLYWSMMLAATNFIDADVLKQTGYTSRKSMKVAAYARAKGLYDHDRGTDKLILIQSVILMGFWYTDAQDHTGAWYWIGIAISLAQSLGLHRSNHAGHIRLRPSDALQRLRKRIWWTILIRDSWISLAKGRPMRIHPEDCDVSLPNDEDIFDDLNLASGLVMNKFVPSESPMLAKMWIRFVNMSSILAKILRLHYRLNGPKPSLEEIDVYAAKLKKQAQDESLFNSATPLVRLHFYQLEMFFQATTAILYRPYVLTTTQPLSGDTEWQQAAVLKARKAASISNTLLEKIIEMDAIRLLKPMIITALIPAMQIHLYDLRSAGPLLSGLAKNRLQLCMLVLSELRETYWSAGVMHRLFGRAQNIVEQHNAQSRGNAAESITLASNDAISHGAHEYGINEQRNTVQSDKVAMLPTPQSEMPSNILTQQVPWDNLTYPSSIDELFNPAFSLSEDSFESIFMSMNGNATEFYDSLDFGSLAN